MTKPGVGVQGALGASSLDDPAMDPGSGIPGVLEEVFSGSAEAPFFSRVSDGRRLLGSRPLLAKFSWPFCQFCGLCPLLQDADEASSASLPAVLLSLD